MPRGARNAAASRPNSEASSSFSANNSGADAGAARQGTYKPSNARRYELSNENS